MTSDTLEICRKQFLGRSKKKFCSLFSALDHKGGGTKIKISEKILRSYKMFVKKKIEILCFKGLTHVYTFVQLFSLLPLNNVHSISASLAKDSVL